VAKSLPSKERIEFIECCIPIYVELMVRQSGNKRRTIAQYQKYLQMGVSAQLPHYMKNLAQHYLYGEHGFAQDAKKARALILALPKSNLNSSSSAFRILAYSYFLDTPANSQQGLAILIEQAKKHPLLYYTLGEIYGDGHIGVEENHDIAKKYYQLAIDNNIAVGNIGLGIFKMNDYDECQDQDQQLKLQREIVEHFKKVDDAGCPDAPYFLGKLYLYEMAGISQNLPVAKAHFEEAISRNDHAYSKAVLAMIAEGYQGEKEFPITYEFIKLESLKASGYIDENPAVMLEYGIISLSCNPITGVHYICKAAYFNDSDAKYFLATIQSFIDRKLFNINAYFMSKINKVDYRHLMKSTPPNHTQSFITLLHQLAARCDYYIEREYTITEEFITDIIINKFFTMEFELDEIEERIKTHFMPESMRKTLLLAENSLKHEKSGDTQCKLATDKLLGPEKPSKKILQKKIARHNEGGKISMHNFGTCLKALITSGLTLSGEDKKAVQAALHIHPPHGRGDKNPHQELEGGRKNTVQFAFDAIQRNLIDASPEGSASSNSNNEGDDSFDTDSEELLANLKEEKRSKTSGAGMN
jgi:TPR repeat protein